MAIDGGLRPLFHQKLREGFHWQSIETGGTGRGVPDSNFCSQGLDRWVEHKQTSAWAVGISPEQAAWHRVRIARGGVTFVAVRQQHEGGPRKGPPTDTLWLYSGSAAHALMRSGLRTEDGLLGRWSGGPSGWDWDAVRGLLLAPSLSPVVDVED